MEPTRREFLQATSAVAAGLALPVATADGKVEAKTGQNVITINGHEVYVFDIPYPVEAVKYNTKELVAPNYNYATYTDFYLIQMQYVFPQTPKIPERAKQLERLEWAKKNYEDEYHRSKGTKPSDRKHFVAKPKKMPPVVYSSPMNFAMKKDLKKRLLKREAMIPDWSDVKNIWESCLMSQRFADENKIHVLCLCKSDPGLVGVHCFPKEHLVAGYGSWELVKDAALLRSQEMNNCPALVGIVPRKNLWLKIQKGN